MTEVLRASWRIRSYPDLLGALSAFAIAFIIGFFVLKSVYRGGVNWAHDYHTYHLPLSLAHFDLSTYELDYGQASLYTYVTPLTHLLQGFAIYLTDRFVVASLLAPLGLLLFNLVLLRYLDVVRLLILNLYLVATPIIAINLPSGLNDTWTNMALTLAVVALVRILDDQRADRPADPVDLGIMVAAATVAYYSKFQAWVTFCFLFLACFACFGLSFARACRRGDALVRLVQAANSRKLAVVLCLLVAIGLSWPIRNWIVIDNPLAPFVGTSSPDHGLSVLKALWHEGRYYEAVLLVRRSTAAFFQPLFTPDALKQASATVRYVMSYFELTRLLSPEPMQWSSSQWHNSAASWHQMMGGLNGLLSLATVVLLVAGVVRKSISPIGPAVLLLLALFISVQNQSHEMRYWLVVPITCYVLLVRAANGGWYRRVVFTTPVVFLLAFASSGAARELSVFTFGQALLDLQPEIERFWASHRPNTRDRPYCIPDYATKPWLTNALSLYFTGPHLREFYVKACRHGETQ